MNFNAKKNLIMISAIIIAFIVTISMVHIAISHSEDNNEVLFTIADTVYLNNGYYLPDETNLSCYFYVKESSIHFFGNEEDYKYLFEKSLTKSQFDNISDEMKENAIKALKEHSESINSYNIVHNSKDNSYSIAFSISYYNDTDIISSFSGVDYINENMFDYCNTRFVHTNI